MAALHNSGWLITQIQLKKVRHYATSTSKLQFFKSKYGEHSRKCMYTLLLSHELSLLNMSIHNEVNVVIEEAYFMWFVGRQTISSGLLLQMIESIT